MQIKLIKRTDIKYKDGTYKWEASCFCGNIFLVRKINVLKAFTRSCGCLRGIAAKARKNPNEVIEFNKDQYINTKFYRYKQSAINKKLIFSLKYTYFKKLLESECHYCGSYDLKFMGVDRVDNSLGYIKENSVACCSGCNYFKGPLNKKDFINFIESIYLNLIKYGEVVNNK